MLKKKPFKENYSSETPCGNPCYLDDPYEGELMSFFMDMYGIWNRTDNRQDIWNFKRKKIVSVDYNSQKFGKITVQKGHWFSSHEQWKFLALPYLDIPIQRRIYRNNEVVRTLNSFEKKIPGMYASVTNVSNDGNEKFGYLSACGVQEVSFERVDHKEVITPYGAFPLFLINETIGSIWYHNQLLGTKMQNQFGSTESILINGRRICPLLTWDSKILTLVSILGGIGDIVKLGLVTEKKYQRFYNIVEMENSLIFRVINGETVPYQLPSVELPNFNNFNC